MSFLNKPGTIGPGGIPYNEVGGQDLFMKEPTETCPDCGATCHAEFVDNGFGPYAVQASPFHCEECGWIQT
jgi:hypothetical protein